MKSTRYLYDIEPSELEQMEYREALEYKQAMAKKLLHRIANESDQLFKTGSDRDRLQQLWNRQKNVYDAMIHTERLIEELDGKEID